MAQQKKTVFLTFNDCFFLHMFFGEKIVPQETLVHVAMDSWVGGYMNMYLQFQNDEPLITPIDVGSQGYLGAETAVSGSYIGSRIKLVF